MSEQKTAVVGCTLVCTATIDQLTYRNLVLCMIIEDMKKALIQHQMSAAVGHYDDQALWDACDTALEKYRPAEG